MTAARERDRGGLVLLVWSLVTIVLVYVPFALQRRFLTGLGLPLGILAAMGLNRWLLSSRGGHTGLPLLDRRARLAAALTVGLSALGNLFLLAVLTLGALNRYGQPDLFARLYLSQDEAVAMQWLLTHAPDEVVLAAPRTGMLLPGRAGVRVFVGHPFETIDAETKQAQAKAFFQGEMLAVEWETLRDDYRIRYVFVGPSERALGGGGDHLRGLAPAFQQGEVTIYRVP